MANTEPKMRSITGKVTPNKLSEREDDFIINVVYQANRTIKDLCKFAAVKSKFTASELESAYMDLYAQAKEELYNASTVEFGFANNSLGVDGVLVGPEPQFDPAVNNVTLRCTPRAEFKEDLKRINVIITGTSDGMPVITKVTDATTGSINCDITPGKGLTGEGNRVRIAGEEGKPVGFFFINSKDQTETPVPASDLLRNDPSFFSFIIPQLADGSYYLEIATQTTGNSKVLVKEVRRNRFPYLLYVGGKSDGDKPSEL